MKINYSKKDFEMFKSKKWLVSNEINSKLAIEIQLFIWKQIEGLKIKNIQPLQLFEFYIDKVRHRLKIYHSQEEFSFLSQQEFLWDSNMLSKDCIVCVYTDGEFTKMSFIEEF